MQETFESLSLANRNIRERANTGSRHALRDRQFLRGLARHFCPGAILELGASTGHLATILQEYDYDVTASEIAPELVRAMAARGLRSVVVDATQDIVMQTGHRFANVIAQAVSPLGRRNHSQLLATLGHIYAALETSGRFINIAPYAWRQPNPRAFFSPREQLEITRACGLFRTIACFPHQVLPPGLYRPWNAHLLNLLDHKLAYVASTRLVWVMEKAGP
jgi:hypothetical protein